MRGRDNSATEAATQPNDDKTMKQPKTTSTEDIAGLERRNAYCMRVLHEWIETALENLWGDGDPYVPENLGKWLSCAAVDMEIYGYVNDVVFVSINKLAKTKYADHGKAKEEAGNDKSTRSKVS